MKYRIKAQQNSQGRARLVKLCQDGNQRLFKLSVGALAAPYFFVMFGNMKLPQNICNRIGYFLSGMGSCFIGVIYFKKGWSYHYGTRVPNEVGILFGCFGIALIYHSIFSENIPKDIPCYVICPECTTSYDAEEIVNQKCPRCNVKVEDVKGFYERHPELKTKDKT